MRGDRPQPTGAATWLAGMLLVIAWGSSSVGTRVGLDSYDPGVWTLLRFLITIAVMSAWAALTRMPLPARRDILPLIGLGIVGISITQLTFSFGIETVDPGTATFLVATVPVMTALLSRFLLGERLAPLGWAGIGLAVVGTVILVLGKGEGLAYTRAALLLLFGAFAEAWYFLLQKPFLLRYTGRQVSTWALMASTLPLLVFLPGAPAQVRAASHEANAALVYVALGAGVVGYLCVSYVSARMPATLAAILMAATPAVALLTAWLWLGIVPSALSVLGGLVAIAGVLLVTLRGAPEPA